MSEGKHLCHWDAVHREYAVIQDFLEFLEDKYDLRLDWEMAKEGTPLCLRKLLDEYFVVDQEALDKERRKLLDSVAFLGSLREMTTNEKS